MIRFSPSSLVTIMNGSRSSSRSGSYGHLSAGNGNRFLIISLITKYYHSDILLWKFLYKYYIVLGQLSPVVPVSSRISPAPVLPHFNQFHLMRQGYAPYLLPSNHSLAQQPLFPGHITPSSPSTKVSVKTSIQSCLILVSQIYNFWNLISSFCNRQSFKRFLDGLLSSGFIKCITVIMIILSIKRKSKRQQEK